MKRKDMRVGMEVKHRRGPRGKWRKGTIRTTPVRPNPQDWVTISSANGVEVYRADHEIEPLGTASKEAGPDV